MIDESTERITDKAMHLLVNGIDVQIHHPMACFTRSGTRTQWVMIPGRTSLFFIRCGVCAEWYRVPEHPFNGVPHDCDREDCIVERAAWTVKHDKWSGL